jgi:periplasmic divalent cation tolerance protein
MIFNWIYITAGSEDEAKKIAVHLLEKHLIACANIFPIRSIYHWKGNLEDEKEFALILKTQEEHVDAIVDEVKKVHSYEVPCIESLPVEKGNPDYLKWIEDETS